LAHDAFIRTDTAFLAAALIGVRPVLVVGAVFALGVGPPVTFFRFAQDAFIRAETAFRAAALMGVRPVLVTVVGLVVA